MKKTLLLLGALLALSCSIADAQNLLLGWTTTANNDCPSGPLSAANRSIACNNNAGENVLIGSVVAPPGLNEVVGVSVIIEVMSYLQPEPLPDWWRFDPGGCRSGAVALNMAFDPALNQGNCGNAWAFNAASAFSYQPNNPYSGFCRLTMVGAIAPQLAVPWPAGTEWYLFRLSITNAKTAGTGACGGCSTPAMVAFTYAQINNTAGTGQDAILNQYATATWQLGPVPARRASWGQIKSQYR